MNEMILVTKREQLFEKEDLAFQGTQTSHEKVQKIIKNLESNLEVMRRGDAEENKHYKQPIPYVVLKRGNQVFAYERLVGGGEERLHNKWSIGVGGHMNTIEGNPQWNEVLRENLNRELQEELSITSSGSLELEVKGLINDDENEVGRVHIGVLVIAELPESAEIEVLEKEQLRGHWVTKNELRGMSNLENWSKIALEVL